MTAPQHIPLPGSARAELDGAERIGPVALDERVPFTVVLRRRNELPDTLVEGPEVISLAELADRHGADPADVELVRQALGRAGVDVLEIHPGSRRIRAAGPAAAVTALFAVELSMVRSTHPVHGAVIEHRARSGELRVPAELDGLVLAVLGLDNRPQARVQIRTLAAELARDTAYYPPALGTVYGFPAGTDGTGQTAAIIELGGGFVQGDLDTYFQGLKIGSPSVRAVSVDGGQNSPSPQPSPADGEVMLDIEVLGALAPKATQLVYFTPNSDRGFVDAVSTAVHATPTPTVLSISWGMCEDTWTGQGRTALDQAFADAAALGVTVCVAAGDNGSTDGQQDGKQHVDFPASSPHVLACGGTSLRVDAYGKVQSETVWNDGPGAGSTGGGVSEMFDLPSWQSRAGVPGRPGGGAGRGVPDVAGDADPQTGYRVRVGGKDEVIGGTSAVAPLWSALVCRLAQALGHRLGLLQTTLYASVVAGRATAGFRDIVGGNNDGYQAGPGWSACTGLGVPEGEALLKVFRDGTTSGLPGVQVTATTETVDAADAPKPETQGWPGAG